MRMTRRFGHRATVLILFGIAWIAMGFSIVGEPLGPATLHTLIPEPIRLALWVTTGTAAIWAAIRRSRRDWYAWTLLYIAPAIRAVSYLIAWVDYLTDPDEDAGIFYSIFGGPGLPRGWIFSLIWTLLTLIIYVCASWPDTRTPTRERGEEQ